jgi:nicotinamidase-related amidase
MKIVCVDFQRDFVSEGGRHYQYRPCIPFIKHIFIPFIRERNYQIVEIISDYRTTASKVDEDVCVPGEWGYQSEIPDDIKMQPVWIKAETTPSWIRAGGGDPDSKPGKPYPDPEAFNEWLVAMIGPPGESRDVVLIGVALEICVLCTIQELKYRGYSVSVLYEGVDMYTGNSQQKKLFLESLTPYWGQVVRWEVLQQQLSE